MKNIALISIFILFFMNFGCGVKKTENTPHTSDTIQKTKTEVLKFIPKELVKSINDCKPGALNCTYIKLNYIEAVEGSIKDKVNGLINSQLTTAYEMPDKNLDNVNLMLETFMKDYEAFKKQFPQDWQVWTIDFIAKVYGETDKTLCLSFYNSNYLGGAHPNTFTVFRNINKETGDTISLINLFGSGFEDKLNKLIDKNYRVMKGLKPGDNLSEKGDLFVNKITFTYNFAVLNDKAIEFYYNAYDIAPYVIGPVVVKISAEDIAGILTGSSPLR